MPLKVLYGETDALKEEQTHEDSLAMKTRKAASNQAKMGTNTAIVSTIEPPKKPIGDSWGRVKSFFSGLFGTGGAGTAGYFGTVLIIGGTTGGWGLIALAVVSLIIVILGAVKKKRDFNTWKKQQPVVVKSSPTPPSDTDKDSPDSLSPSSRVRSVQSRLGLSPKNVDRHSCDQDEKQPAAPTPARLKNQWILKLLNAVKSTLGNENKEAKAALDFIYALRDSDKIAPPPQTKININIKDHKYMHISGDIYLNLGPAVDKNPEPQPSPIVRIKETNDLQFGRKIYTIEETLSYGDGRERLGLPKMREEEPENVSAPIASASVV